MEVTQPESCCEVELRSVLDCVANPAIVVRDDFRIVAANRAYRDRYSRGEPVCGGRCHEVSHHNELPCDQAGESCPVRQCLETGEPSRLVHVHFSREGHGLEEVVAYPIPDEDGEASRFLEILQPVGEADEADLAGRSRRQGLPDGHSFSGNVHELLRILRPGARPLDADRTLPGDLAAGRQAGNGGGPPPPTGIVPLAQIERWYLRWAAASFPGAKLQLARRLGMSERTLYRKLRAARSVAPADGG